MASKVERLDILRRARARLAVPGQWIKGAYARDMWGEESLGWCPEIEVCWCAVGALRADGGPGSWQEAGEELEPHAPEGLSLFEFNDACDSVDQVLDVYDRAIARLETECGHV